MFNLSQTELSNRSIDMGNVIQLSNIGEFGIGKDYSKNKEANAFQNIFPFFNWLAQTNQSLMAKSAFNNGSLQITKDHDGNFQVTLPYKWGTTYPESTKGECCWIAPDLAKCGANAPFNLLCMKECQNVMEKFLYDKERFQRNDMISYYMRQGETYNDAKMRFVKDFMAFFTIRNLILGTSDTTTDTLKKFHGVMEVMEGADVIKILGTNILGAFDEIRCRSSVIGEGSDVVFVCHPLVMDGIRSVITKGQNGEYPEGWSRDGDEITFRGHKFIEDKLIPVDVTAGNGEVWMCDGDALGELLITTPRPENEYVFESDTHGKTPTEGCGNICTYMYNAGLAFTSDPNKLAVITKVPMSANCLGSKLDGLDYVITPETIVPILTD